MKITADQKNLIQRYLLWCYKTTKEDLDRIDRKFTQLVADAHILNTLKKLKEKSFDTDWPQFERYLDDFKGYIAKKQQEALTQKFCDPKTRKINPQYLYLQIRLQAVEKTIVRLLGSASLKKIKALYEEEMTRRILEAEEHT